MNLSLTQTWAISTKHIASDSLKLTIALNMILNQLLQILPSSAFSVPISFILRMQHVKLDWLDLKSVKSTKQMQIDASNVNMVSTLI